MYHLPAPWRRRVRNLPVMQGQQCQAQEEGDVVQQLLCVRKAGRL